ncbi:MAG TPA: FkbM family methyltransferase [Candidatus Polarisedimenticolia bacterium]|nr:FkbM family methyltransferase [Candidatus Polarisedimenticolia bacterium]
MLAKIKRWLLLRLPPTWAGRLRAWRVRHLIRTFPARVVEHSYGGSRLKVFLADPLSQGWYDGDWPALPEIASLQQSRLRSGARVFDVGAHQGVVAAMLAGVVGPAGQVVAVEASLHNCRAAARNRELNGLSQIEVVQAAVADRPGTLYFNQGLNGQLDDGSGARGRLAVEAITLDQLAERFGPPDVVFLDIEGAECLALSGAPLVLASGADFFVEVHVGCGLEKLSGSVAQLLSYFPSHRFDLMVRAEEDDSFRPFRQDDPLTSERFYLLARCRGAEAGRAGAPGPAAARRPA